MKESTWARASEGVSYTKYIYIYIWIYHTIARGRKSILAYADHLICDIQMRDGTIEVIVTPLTNGTRASRRTWVVAARADKRDIAGGCQTPTGKAGHALLPFRAAKWKSKRYNGVATSPRSIVPSVPSRSYLSSLSLSLCLFLSLSLPPHSFAFYARILGRNSSAGFGRSSKTDRLWRTNVEDTFLKNNNIYALHFVKH